MTDKILHIGLKRHADTYYTNYTTMGIFYFN